MTTYTSQTFTNLFYAMHHSDVFESCTFQVSARKCNFALATFTDCTFTPGFKFVDCNCAGVTGLNAGLIEGGAYSTKEQYDEQKRIMREKMKLPIDPPEEELIVEE